MKIASRGERRSEEIALLQRKAETFSSFSGRVLRSEQTLGDNSVIYSVFYRDE